MQKTDKSYRKNLHQKIYNHVPEEEIKKRNADKSWKYGGCDEYNMVVISKDGTIGEVLSICELLIALPSVPNHVRFQEMRDEDQKWGRYSIPNELINFDKIYKDEANIEAKWKEIDKKHLKFIQADIKRKFNGDWFMNDGEPIYITGYYYFFLQHYFLTDMRRYGDFRMPQRDYFLFLEACFADEKSIGLLLLKSRRSAFSTSSGSTVLCKSITYLDGFFPIVSKKDKDAEILFINHIVKPLLQLPKYLQPQRSGEVVPKKELLFASSKKKLTVNNKADVSDEGLNTLVTFYGTTLDAYDGTQPILSINDEIGKMKGNLDINEYWEQAHKMCHIVGSQIVGKALCGSTANPPNKGGKNYQKFYADSKLSSRDKTGSTKTGLYAIFIPADYSTMGFFDEFGYVIYDDPTEPIKNELGQMIDIGVKRFLDEREVACQGDIKKLNAQKRNNPRIDTDPFLDEDATNMYATTGMTNHVNFLKDYVNSEKYNKQVFRFNLFYKPTPDNPLNVELIHTDKGKYIASWLPPKELRNNFRIKDGKRVPTNDNLGSLGADPYQADRAKHGTGSKMGLVGVTANNTVNLVEVERNKTFVFYNHRPDTVEEAEDDVMKLMLYLSMPILPETNKDGLVRRLHKEGLRGYVISDPFKKKSELSPSNLKFGGITTSIANKGKQEQSLETYINQYVTDDIDENNIKAPFLELNEMALEYAENTRTKLDGMVAWMLATVAVQHKVIKERHDIKEETKTYTRIIDLFKKEVV